MPPLLPAPIAVLDTNVVLDWLVFREGGCAPLAAAIESGRLHWVASAWMREEMEHVLDRGVATRWRPDRQAIARAWERWATVVLQPEALAPAQRLHCTDPLDQPFIDLALHVGAHWLISKDKALLKLARRAAPRQLSIGTPQRWMQRAG